MGETILSPAWSKPVEGLSVSSNGSTWVKPVKSWGLSNRLPTFSILERIDVGETPMLDGHPALLAPPFSILERIDVGETRGSRSLMMSIRLLSVSSNGSTWVKPCLAPALRAAPAPFSILERIDVGETCYCSSFRYLLFSFQYPRTDRRG